MKDWRVIHLNQVSKERRAFIEEIGIPEARIKTARKEYPEGSIWLWSLSSVFGPKGSAEKETAE